MQHDKVYSFDVTSEDREAIYTSLCAAMENPSHGFHMSREDLLNINSAEAVLSLNQNQLRAVLMNLSKAIDNAANRADDWLRAQEYEVSRAKIIDQARKHMFIV